MKTTLMSAIAIGSIGSNNILSSTKYRNDLLQKLKALGTYPDKEYELIMQKKSLLSADMRRQVVRYCESKINI